MKNKTVFVGQINGKQFDNVQEYNQYFVKLLNDGETNIKASSSTEVKPIEEEGYGRSGCSVKMFDVTDDTYYPYMSKTSKHYLDLLVSTDHDNNNFELNNMISQLDSYWNYIVDDLDNDRMTQTFRYKYLDNIRENCLKRLDEDKERTNAALRELSFRREKLEKELIDIAESEVILRDSLPVIDELTKFYNTIESEVIESIAENNAKNVDSMSHNITCCHCGKPVSTCSCDPNDVRFETSCTEKESPKTSCTEKESPKTFSLDDIFNRVFGNGYHANTTHRNATAHCLK